jgi:hypothetical protein
VAQNELLKRKMSMVASSSLLDFFLLLFCLSAVPKYRSDLALGCWLPFPLHQTAQADERVLKAKGGRDDDA